MLNKNKTMKNIIIIDIDSEREAPITIGKPSDVKKPTTQEEAKSFILTDIACVVETLKLMISIADQNKYGNKKAIVDEAIEHLNELLIVSDKEPKIESTDNTKH